MNTKYQLDEKLNNALSGEDELGLVVRSHIHLEEKLNQILKLLTPNPELLPKLRFEQNVNLACALGLSKSLLSPLKELGSIRNLFGHKLNTLLTDGSVTVFFDCFSQSDKALIVEAYKITNSNNANSAPENFSSLTPRDRFKLIAVAFDGILGQCICELNARVNNA